METRKILDPIKTRSVPKSLFLVGFLVILFLTNLIGANKIIESAFSFTFSPIHFYASHAGNSINETFSTISNIGELRDENNDLKIENASLKTENEAVAALIRENQALANQLNLANTQPDTIKVNVVSNGVEGAADYLIISAGSNQGIKEGDVAYWGNAFIGRISDVTLKTSKIILPTNKASYYEVLITPSIDSDTNLETLKSYVAATVDKTYKGVSIGYSNTIHVENINRDANVNVGDAVLLNDEKITYPLLLGVIEKIESNPADTSKVVVVNPTIDFENLMYLFVQISTGTEGAEETEGGGE